MLHTVRRGDSLWRLAFQFQGSGTQWPKLVKHHNDEVASRGPNSGLLAIKDPNLIFIGQTLHLPPRAESIEQGAGEKCDAEKQAKDVDLPAQLVIGRDTPPCVWLSQSPDWDIKVEFKGDITMEMTSESRHRHNLKILLSKDSAELELRLRELYDPAIRKLLAEPSVRFDFESGKVEINTPIATEANLGPYTIKVKPVTPNHLSGTIRPETVSATVKADGLDYKYSADMEFKADVDWHPRPRIVPEPVAETENELVSKTGNEDMIEPSSHTTKWERMVNERGYVVAFVSFVVYAFCSAVLLIAGKGTTMKPSTTSIPPFIHKIDYRNVSRES